MTRADCARDTCCCRRGAQLCGVLCLQVGFDREGKLLALDVQLYNNAGNSLDLSAAIMDRALLHTDNAYKIPHLRVVGHICKTHCGSNTAFRGFGGPQVGPHQLHVVAAHALYASHHGCATALRRSVGLHRKWPWRTCTVSIVFWAAGCFAAQRHGFDCCACAEAVLILSLSASVTCLAGTRP